MKAFFRGNKPFAAYERIVQNTNVSKITPFWDVPYYRKITLHEINANFKNSR